MQLPLQITFHGVEASAAVEASIREHAERLERFYDHIMSCRVVIEAPHRHHHQGNLFHVRIDLKVPERELVVAREPAEHHAHEDPYVTIRDAFDAMRRQLEDYARERRGAIKSHDEPSHGLVTKLFPEEGYGFVTTADGREVYFHRNSVLGGRFEKLEVGTPVRFAEETGEKGPQASTVWLEGKSSPG